jgi:hypothetical protein
VRGKLLGLNKQKNVQPIIVWILFLAWERALNNYRKITSILSILEASSYWNPQIEELGSSCSQIYVVWFMD